MKKADLVAKRNVESLSAAVSERPDQGGNPNRPRQDHVDAINRIFAEFELAYHNQYHKAFAEEGSLQLTKKYWLNRLSRFSPDLLLRATRKVVDSQPYLPTLASIIAACENSMALFGLPAPREAYLEACTAASPKAEQDWSHPAVYLAGKAAGWFELANLPEARVLPLFEYHYRALAARAINGESLSFTQPAPLPETIERELTSEENRDRLRRMKEAVKL